MKLYPIRLTTILLLLFFALSGYQLKAQKKKVPENLPNFERKHYHFGFLLGINSSDFLMGADVRRTDSLLVLEPKSQNGFNLGIVSALHFSPLWSLRFTPSLSFAERQLTYRFLTNNVRNREKIKPIESTYIEFPLLFKFRSQRYNNFAAFLLGGGKYSLDLASQQHVDNRVNQKEEIVVKIKKHSYSYELGVGTDFFLQYFKFSLQFTYSAGINNVFIQDNTDFSRPIDYLKPKMWVLSCTFEG